MPDRCSAGNARATVKCASGMRLVRPADMLADVVRRIVRLYRAGHAWSKIARGLNESDVPTDAGGRKWYASTVRAVVQAHRAAV